MSIPLPGESDPADAFDPILLEILDVGASGGRLDDAPAACGRVAPRVKVVAGRLEPAVNGALKDATGSPNESAGLSVAVAAAGTAVTEGVLDVAPN